MGRTVKIGVICSVLLNVLFAGILIGSLSHRLFTREPPWRHPPGISIKLPPDKEKLLGETMEKVWMENRDLHRQVREAREKTLSILTAADFDPEAYQVEVNKIHSLMGLLDQRLADTVKGLAGQFNQEERKGLAEHLRRPPLPPGGEGPPGPPPDRGGPPGPPPSR
jgi:uncharacterized membrane protein